MRWSVPDGFTVAPDPLNTRYVSLVDPALSTCAGRRTAGRWARSQGWSRAARLVSSRSSTIPHCVGRRQQGTGQAASRQLWPWVTRSLQLVGHLDSSYRPGTEALRPTRALHCAPVCPLFTPCVPHYGRGSVEKRLRSCNYSCIVMNGSVITCNSDPPFPITCNL